MRSICCWIVSMLCAAACGDNIHPDVPSSGAPPGGGDVLTGLRIMDAPAVLAPGAERQIRAVADLADGSTRDVTRQVAWSSSKASVIEVSPAGGMAARAEGAATISAALAPFNATAMIMVVAAGLRGVEVAPARLVSPAGLSRQLSATGLFDDGSTRDLTAVAAWSSSDAAVAGVDRAGGLAALVPGAAIVTAAVGQQSGAASILVTDASLASIAISAPSSTLPAGAAMQLTATGTYSDGSQHDLTDTAAWSAEPAGIASVSDRGLVTGASPGAARLRAAIGPVASAELPVTVTSGAISRIEVTPAMLRIPAGVAQPAAAIAHYSDGSSLDVTPRARWASSAPAVAEVSNAGLVSARVPGAAEVSATLDGVTGYAPVTVTSARLITLVIEPAQLAVATGAEGALAARARFSDGSDLDVTPQALWATSDAGIAEVSNGAGTQGRVTALAPGAATITAVLRGADAAAAVTVSPAELAAIEVSPDLLALSEGQTTQLTATGHYTDGSRADVTAAAQWSSTDAAVGTVSAPGDGSGLVRARGVGAATLTAALGGRARSVPLTVVSTCHLVINEVTIGHLLSPQNEFIEIYNPCGLPVALGGINLVYQDVAGTTDVLLVALSGTLAAGGYGLYVGLGWSAGGHPVSGVFTHDLNPLGGGVGLREAATSVLIDGFAWNLAENELVEGAPLADLPLGTSAARTPNGHDTDRNWLDFRIQHSSTPGAAN